MTRDELRAWLDRGPPRICMACGAIGSEPCDVSCGARAVAYATKWRRFLATECACTPVPVADGTFGFKMSVCDACQDAREGVWLAPGSTKGDKLAP